MNTENRPSSHKVLWFLTGLILVLFLYHLERGYSETISWTLSSEAHKESFESFSVSKGPFNFDLTGNLYFIKQLFSASPIEHSPGWLLFYSLVALVGLSGFLAIATYWKRYTFIAVCAGYMVFLNSLQLDALGLFGFPAGSKYLTIILVIIIIGPAYFLHAFREQSSLFFRWGLLFALTGGAMAICGWNIEGFSQYAWGNGIYGMAIFTLLFLFLIAEEIVYLILHIITQNKGGTGNEKHFLIFGAVYISYITLYYLEKSAILDTNYSVLNPYYFLVVSTVVAAWTIRYKQSLIDAIAAFRIDTIWLWFTLALLAFSFLNLQVARGNDAGYEAMHYLIIYTHVGFGFMFFVYIISNFINPLAQGLQVHKIVYNDRNMPYSTARLGGLAAVAAFFFLANKEPMELLISAKFNLLADYHASAREEQIAKEYLIQSSQYGWDNHYANYRLARLAEENNNPAEAYYRYFRASRRYPSPYAYVNAARDLTFMKKDSEIVPLLREAQADFPDNAEIKNNLALALVQNGAINEASSVLEGTKTSDEWNMATQVNRWWITYDSLDEVNIEDANVELRSNILAKHIAQKIQPPFRPDIKTFEGQIDLHKIVYLINTNWRFPQLDSAGVSDLYAGEISLAELKLDLNHSAALAAYRSDKPIDAFKMLDKIQYSANSLQQGFYLNQIGILALDLSAPRLALDFFRRASEAGLSQSDFNMMVAMLEAGSWDELNQKIARDPALRMTIPEDITKIIEDSAAPDPLTLYFRWRDYAPEELATQVSSFESDQIVRIWKRIFDHFSASEELETMDLYFSSLQPFLPDAEVSKYQLYAKAHYYPTDKEKLVQAAFDEWAIYNWLDYDTASLETKYEVLFEVTEYNPFSEGLLKRYSVIAIQLGLFEYAEYALLSLYEILPRDEYNKFERYFDKLKKEKQQESWSF